MAIAVIRNIASQSALQIKNTPHIQKDCTDTYKCLFPLLFVLAYKAYKYHEYEIQVRTWLR